MKNERVVQIDLLNNTKFENNLKIPEKLNILKSRKPAQTHK